jgi:hypothetical protein
LYTAKERCISKQSNLNGFIVQIVNTSLTS